MPVQTMQIAWENQMMFPIVMFVAHRTVSADRGDPNFAQPRRPPPAGAGYSQYEYPVSTGYQSLQRSTIAPHSSFVFTVAYEAGGPYTDYWYVAIQLGIQPGNGEPEAYSAGGTALFPQAFMTIAAASTVRAWVQKGSQGDPVIFLRPDGFVPPRVGHPPLWDGLPMTRDPVFCPWPAKRKSVAALTEDERKSYAAAVLGLKKAPSELNPPTKSRYDDYVFTHMLSMFPITVNDPKKPVQNGNITVGEQRANMWAHMGPQFIAWHREFLHRFELDLYRKLADAGGAEVKDGYWTGLPYWDWTVTGRAAGTAPWLDDFMGGDGTGSFAGADHWPITLTDDGAAAVPSALTRGFGRPDFSLPVADDVTKTLAQTEYDASPWDNSATLSSFRNELEGWYSPANPPQLPAMHNLVHNWVGGSMNEIGSAPNDPVFFLHHCYIDRLWAVWQRQHPDAAAYLPNVPVDGVQSLDQPMKFTDPTGSAPWTAPPATPGQVVSNLALNYVFEEEVPAVLHAFTIQSGDSAGSEVYYYSTNPLTPPNFVPAAAASFRVFTSQAPGTVPVYLFTLPMDDSVGTLVYYYSVNPHTPPNFTGPVPAFYAYPAAQQNAVPVYLYTGKAHDGVPTQLYYYSSLADQPTGYVSTGAVFWAPRV